jgi:hypothetical protein
MKSPSLSVTLPGKLRPWRPHRGIPPKKRLVVGHPTAGYRAEHPMRRNA